MAKCSLKISLVIEGGYLKSFPFNLIFTHKLRFIAVDTWPYFLQNMSKLHCNYLSLSIYKSFYRIYILYLAKCVRQKFINNLNIFWELTKLFRMFLQSGQKTFSRVKSINDLLMRYDKLS